MSWLQKLMPSRIRTEGGTKRTVPEGLWTKCDSCQAVLYRPELERNLSVCPKCGMHMAVTARTRLDQFLDQELVVGRRPFIGLRVESGVRLHAARSGSTRSRSDRRADV